MAYWQFFYHVVWATKTRLPLITPEIEPFLFQALAVKAKELEGHAFAINGMPDHVHIVAVVPPKVAFSHFVNVLKGSTSRYISLEYKIPFEWQDGYGAFTVSKRNLKSAISYVEGQKAHHANGTTNRLLEYTSERNEGPKILPSS